MFLGLASTKPLLKKASLAAILNLRNLHCFRVGLYKATAEEDRLSGHSSKALMKKATLAAILNLKNLHCFRAGLHKAAAEEDHLGRHP
jgi:hypothetical protein